MPACEEYFARWSSLPRIVLYICVTDSHITCNILVYKMTLSCSTVYYIPDFGYDYQPYVDSTSILDFVVLVLDILDFADSMNLNFYMDTSFDLVFCSLLKNYSYTNRNNLKLTFELVLVYTSFLLLKISFPLIIYKSRRPSYNHDHWIRVDSHWRSSIRILLVDCDNYARML